MDALNPTLAYLAGALSILSPCVLPLVPIVLGAAGASHRLAPLALAGGLVFSFTLVGVFLATAGFAIGIKSELVRRGGGAALSLIGVVLLTPSMQAQFAHASGPLSAWAQERMSDLEASGLPGQAGLGLLLGVVWSPCVGPTLGAASLLAAQGRNLEQVAFVMLAFGAGAASVMLALGYFSAGVLKKLQKRMRATGGGRTHRARRSARGSGPSYRNRGRPRARGLAGRCLPGMADLAHNALLTVPRNPFPARTPRPRHGTHSAA